MAKLKNRSIALSMTASCLSAALLVSGCSSGNSNTEKNSESNGQVTASGISAERCEKNKAAGQLTFLTSFDYAASASIVDAVVADELGYFKKMCLDVKLQSGFSNDNIALVSENRASFTGLGSSSEVEVAAAKQAKLKAIAVEGHSPVEALAASGKSKISNLSDVKGTTMGVLGSIPYSVRVMLTRAGIDLEALKQVQVPFDATLLDKGDFQSRPVYKSNEPRQLDKANIAYKLFDPATQNIAGSFGVMVASDEVIAKHPTAVEDFLRADMAGLRYAMDNPADAVKMAFKRTDPKYYLSSEGEDFRWSVESKLVKESTPANQPLGFIDPAAWDTEVKPLVDELHTIPSLPATSAVYDTRFISAIYDGTKLIWPTS